MGRLIPLLFLAEVALVAVALISCLSAEEDEIRTLPRFAWVFIILIFPLVGAIAWFVAGRPAPIPADPAGARWAGGFGSGAGERGQPQRRPLAPDDDPEFLRSLNTEQARRDRELLSRWEDDLRRRETELRRGDAWRKQSGGAQSGGKDQEDNPPKL